MIFGINFLKTQLAIHFVLPVKYKFHKNIEIYFKNFINNNNYVLLEEPSYILQFDGPKKLKTMEMIQQYFHLTWNALFCQFNLKGWLGNSFP